MFFIQGYRFWLGGWITAIFPIDCQNIAFLAPFYFNDIAMLDLFFCKIAIS